MNQLEKNNNGPIINLKPLKYPTEVNGLQRRIGQYLANSFIDCGGENALFDGFINSICY